MVIPAALRSKAFGPVRRMKSVAIAMALCCTPMLPQNAAAGETNASPLDDPGYARCVTGMIEGFSNGLDEGWCAGNYALPSAFNFKCLKQLSVGFDSPLDRAACINYFREAAGRAENQRIRQSHYTQ